MFKKILIVLALIIIGFVIVVLLQPSDFRITRSTLISAPPAAVFAQVNDFHKWEAWSPWTKTDPKCKFSYEGPTAGPGAIFRWDGDMEVGAGNMTITETRPSDLILIRLEFTKPMAGVNDTEFNFTEDGPKTKVTWTMSGKNNFVAKAVGLFMNCDKIVGGMFEKGLSQMKSIVEAAPKS